MNVKTNIILLLTVVAAGLLSSCYSSLPISREAPQNNETYEVDYLFEHDGCKVYRFYDRDNWVYFTNCRGDVTSIKNDSTAGRVTNSIRITYDDYNEMQKNR
ncbi:DUF4884 domain-containing protein [uncultured Proteiniphilum sp.]|uniref:DUF4884 domain-containing protein n=1 Tax=uncultured Proteiniphilum sp. TaxID=497637 RepID=UPI002632AC45|nr:DUF4884 domain-containing protein [uncultured Proteiniphilum sp.]